MAPAQDLTGILVALITPYTPDGAVDLPGVDAHVQRLIKAGVHGLVPGGSTGEFAALTIQERKDVLEQCVKSAAGRIPVVAGIGDCSTAVLVDLAQHAAKVGATALMVLPPYYDSPDLATLKEILSDVHKASNLPIMYYNIPSATGVNLSPAEIASLTEVGVKWLKDTSGNAPALTDLLFHYNDRITALNGWDTLTFYGIAAGAKGSVWGAANIIPELAVELWDTLAVKGDIKKARELWTKIFPVCKWLESHSHYGAAVKTGMELRGWKTGGVRKPWKLIEGDSRTEITTALKSAGVQTI
ncbi:dihydrodipicolinate synthase [Fusarium albosuccineum]|uniref:Dihydrodipicolinate synthase n=1 Tax=Fusarium albosuccineum TaxID=1237068 RepID=A0A8H4L3W9_9HYPO|nr:dihydrodipicolinate synthase [Fusarium albosuccineum]